MTSRPTSAADLARICPGDSEMSRLVREFDWATTSLGPVKHWPPSLRSAVALCLASRFSIVIFWGRDLLQIYNDAFIPILGSKHPALGQPSADCWSEMWPQIEPLYRHVFETGTATRSDDIHLPVFRSGYLEESFYTMSYTPIFLESGEVGGVFNVVTETTSQVVSTRRTRTLRDLAAHAVETSTVGDACKRMAAVLASSDDVRFMLAYLLDDDGHLHLTCESGLRADAPPAVRCERIVSATDSPWPLFAALERDAPIILGGIDQSLGLLAVGPWGAPVEHAVVQSLSRPGTERRYGVIVFGVTPQRALDDDFRGFLSLIAGQVSVAIGNARAFEEERARAEALAEIDRAKTAFFSNVSHELRTPLTLMLGPLEDALEDAIAPAARESLQVAHRNGLRLLRLVNTLLDFSRIEAGHAEGAFEAVDVAALTADLASVFRSAIERAGLSLAIRCERPQAPVYLDREMWEKIVLNLLSNAFKFTLVGGIAVTLSDSGAAVVLTVEDTGVGIPREELPHVFERFHRVGGVEGRTHEGSGIGLALVSELVQLHGGTVRVESTIGQGSRFIVSIPTGVAHLPPDRIGAERARTSTAIGAAPFVEEAARWLPEDDALAGPMPAMPDTGSSTSNVRVLVADDNADMRSYLARLLRAHWTVESVADGEAALASAWKHPPDLVLSDVMMPRLDGIGLARAMRRDPRFASVPIVLLSARAGEEARVEGLEAGIDGYLTKPFSARELIARVNAHLALARARREADETIRHRGLQFEALLEAAPLGVYLVDADLRIREANPIARAVFGDIGALEGRGLDEVVHMLWRTASADEVVRIFRHTLATGTPFHAPEWREERLGRGAFEIYEWQLHRIPLPDRRFGVVCYFREISAQVAVREQLRRNRDTFYDLIANNPFGIYVVDADFRLAQVSLGAQETFRNVRPLLGRDFAEVLRVVWQEPFATEAIERFRHTLGTGESYTSASTIERRADIGATEAYDWRIERITLPDGRFGVVCYYYDLSERMRWESALRESEERFRHMADHAPVMVWVTAPSGDCEYFGKSWYDFTGQAPAAALGLGWLDAVHPEDRPAAEAARREANESRRKLQREYRVRRAGGEYCWVIDSAAPRFSADGAFLGHVGSVIDIDERKALEERLARQVATLAEADRRKDEFLAMLGHELRNPLSGLRNAIATASLDPLRGPRALEIARRQTDQLGRLVEDLLDVARMTQGRIALRTRRMSLAAVLERAVENARSLIEDRGIALEVAIAPVPIMLDADPTRLDQVFVNLLGNAGKYTEPGGTVFLRAELEADEAVVSVRDTGIGIAPDLLPRIWDLFAQADCSLDRSQGGLGIGLTLARRLVELHGGSVFARSDGPGMGAEFTVRLPARVERADAVVAGPRSNPAQGGRPAQVLIVEDNLDAAQSLAMILEILGHRVRAVHDGLAALEAARISSPDVMLVDIGLPGMNGYEVARQIRRDPLLRHVRLVALTGYGQAEDKERSTAAGFDHHLVKPVDLDALSTLVARVTVDGAEGGSRVG